MSTTENCADGKPVWRLVLEFDAEDRFLTFKSVGKELGHEDAVQMLNRASYWAAVWLGMETALDKLHIARAKMGEVH